MHRSGHPERRGGARLLPFRALVLPPSEFHLSARGGRHSERVLHRPGGTDPQTRDKVQRRAPAPVPLDLDDQVQLPEQATHLETLNYSVLFNASLEKLLDT